jgi:Glycosyl hydrolases family 31/Domain of unknown function (DUF5110)
MRTRRLPALPILVAALAPAPPAAAAATNPVVIHDGPARFEVLSPTLFRLEYAADGGFEDAPTLTALHRRAPRTKVRTRVVEGVRVIKTSRAVLRYRLDSGPFGPSNLALTIQVGAERRTVHPSFTATSAVRADAGPPVATSPNPGDPAPRTSGNLGGWYRGLDGQGAAVPLHDGILSRDGWYLLDDTTSPRLIEDGRWYSPRPDHAGPYQDGYLFAYGHDYAAALRDFRELTGAAPLLPRKAFGNWFSQYQFRSAADYRRLLAKFRAERVSLDVLVVDTDFKWPNPWNGWQWTPAFGADPAGFLDWAQSQGIDVALNVHPSISRSDPAFAAADSTAGGLGGDSGRCRVHLRDPNASCAVFDWARLEQAAAYFGLHAPFEQQGVDFWWLDWNNDESDARAPGLTADTWINSLYAARQAERGRRWLALSRIGSSFWNYHAAMPGVWAEHRSAIHFTGDAYATWPMLDFQIRMTTAEGAGIGLPYVSHDIGSFHGERLPSDMYVRWVQFGAFQPILRLHSNHGYRLPWQYGPRAERIASGFLRLRGALVPYLYSAAREAYDTGVPIARPMYLDWPGAAAAYAYDGQYMLGDELLVAPVTKPGASAVKRVWFPPGTWIDVFTGETHRGGRGERLAVPLERMPVFARAGAIVPRQPDPEDRGGHPDLALDVYAGGSGASEIYEDAGEGFGYRRGRHARTPLRWSEGADALTIGGARGGFPGMRAERRYLVRFVGVERPDRVTIGSAGRTRELRGWSYDPATRRLEAPTGLVGVRGGATVRLHYGGPR